MEEEGRIEFPDFTRARVQNPDFFLVYAQLARAFLIEQPDVFKDVDAVKAEAFAKRVFESLRALHGDLEWVSESFDLRDAQRVRFYSTFLISLERAMMKKEDWVFVLENFRPVAFTKRKPHEQEMYHMLAVIGMKPFFQGTQYVAEDPLWLAVLRRAAEFAFTTDAEVPPAVPKQKKKPFQDWCTNEYGDFEDPDT